MIMNEIFLNGKYQVVSGDPYFFKKYGDPVPTFQLDDTADAVFGKDWKEKQQMQPFMQNFMSRIMKMGLSLYDIEEPILFGKISAKGQIMRFPELVLRSELKYNHSIKEFNLQVKTKKIKIKSLTN
tara:strand:+ start:6992 stop:7369 length:378 start_codon:yes stop_codon:yes gene_type:complete